MNQPLAPTQKIPMFDWIIVDSRYRTMDLGILKYAPTTIWRCTDEEYDSEWANNFTFTIHTSHDGEVRFLRTVVTANTSIASQFVWKNFTPQKIKVVDTCGAGDTFTAAVGAWLATQERYLTPEAIANAIPFAIECAQEVCQMPMTAITTKRV